MFGCSDVYHWMGFGTYLQHGQSPPASTSRTAAVDTRTYHGSQRAALTEMEIRASLPKTPVGKLSKKELLAEELAKQQAGNVHPANAPEVA